MCKVGFVGLGIMGAPMSRNLMKDGYSVMVFNRSRAPMEAAAADGAEMADSLAHLASECGIIFTMLPNSPQVKEVILGEGGLASAAKPGTLFIDMTSGAPGDSKEIYAALKEKGQPSTRRSPAASPWPSPGRWPSWWAATRLILNGRFLI